MTDAEAHAYAAYRRRCLLRARLDDEPLASKNSAPCYHVTIVETIGATTTKTGLKVQCALDPRTYEKGIKVSKAQMASLAITGDDFHPEWNYTVKPRCPET